MLRTPVRGTRLDILQWFEKPAVHFPARHHADIAAHGVRAELVAAKLGVSRRVAETHLELLVGIGLLRATRIRRRTYYRRDEVRIAEVARLFEKGWQ